MSHYRYISENRSSFAGHLCYISATLAHRSDGQRGKNEQTKQTPCFEKKNGF